MNPRFSSLLRGIIKTLANVRYEKYVHEHLLLHENACDALHGNQEERGQKREHLQLLRTQKWEHPRQAKISSKI
jgi:hypothetical protein